MVSLHNEYWGDMDSIVYKSNFYNICIIYESTFQICILRTQSLFTLKNKMPELKIAFCVHQNARKYHGRLVLYPGHRNWYGILLWKYDYLWCSLCSAISFKFIITALLLLFFFFFFCTSCIIPQLSSPTCRFAVSHNLTVTFFHLFSPTLYFAPQKHIKKVIFWFFHFAYSQQSSAKVTKKVPSKKESRGVSAWTLLLFRHSKAFYKPLSFFPLQKPALCGKLCRIEMPIMNVFSSGSRWWTFCPHE